MNDIINMVSNIDNDTECEMSENEENMMIDEVERRMIDNLEDSVL